MCLDQKIELSMNDVRAQRVYLDWDDYKRYSRNIPNTVKAKPFGQDQGY